MTEKAPERTAQLTLSSDPSLEEIKGIIQTWVQDAHYINEVYVSGKQLSRMLNLSPSMFTRYLREVKAHLGMILDDEMTAEFFFDWMQDNYIEFKQRMKALSKQEALGMQTFYNIMMEREEQRKENKVSPRDPIDVTLLEESTKLIDNSNKGFSEVVKNFGKIIDSFQKLTNPEQGIPGAAAAATSNTQINVGIGEVLDAFDKAERGLPAQSDNSRISEARDVSGSEGSKI